MREHIKHKAGTRGVIKRIGHFNIKALGYIPVGIRYFILNQPYVLC